MGTSSLTVVYNSKKVPVLCMQKHSDGQTYAYGAQLARFLCAKQIVQGIPCGDTSTLANGVECLAAQLVAHFKQGCGGIYLVPLQRVGECNYEYHVTQNNVQVLHYGSPIFKGTHAQFEDFCNNY